MALEIVLNPEQRRAYLDTLLAHDALSHIEEDPDAAYCFISLTNVPDELKPHMQRRQQLLMDKILAAAGITAYDPGSAPYSPDTNLTTRPDEVYAVDSGKIVGARFFVGHNILPSSGVGIEQDKATFFNRMAVILMDRRIRVSRMQPNRAIYLQYDNFGQDCERFIPVFELLKQYDPGMGLHDGRPVLLGFHRETGEVVDLEELVYMRFPDLKYEYDGTADIPQFSVTNPGLFYENN